MRKPASLGIVCIICLVASLAVDLVALGQAGSVGGALGKTDKSASGGDEAAEPHAQGRAHTRLTVSPLITGRWRWQSDCGGGRNGSFEINHVSAGAFSGTIVNGDHSIGDISGRISANSISFTNSVGPETWTGTFASGHMSGSVSVLGGLATCQWTASR
jgi:hypothetical protein